MSFEINKAQVIFESEENGLWYFWDENFKFSIGPYECEEDAAKAAKKYYQRVD